MLTKTVLLHPTGDVLKGWTPTPPGADHYLLVNGNPLVSDDAATFIFSNTQGQRERLSLERTPSDLISSVGLTLRARVNGSNNLGIQDTISVRLFADGVDLAPQITQGFLTDGAGAWFYISALFQGSVKAGQQMEIEFTTETVWIGSSISDFDISLEYNKLPGDFTPILPPVTAFTPVGTP